MLQSVDFYYFSPTGGTKKAGLLVAEALAEHVNPVDLGKPELPELPAGDPAELAVIAAPVFGGRLPSLTTERLEKLQGNGTKAVTLAVYGNRAYEDALLELNDIISGAGFRIVASAAPVAQHSMVPEVAAGRPDEEDTVELRQFAGQILQKLEQGSADQPVVPGNRPYKADFSMSVTPVSLPACRLCGTCAAVCPAQAIRLENGGVVTDADTCILCMACTAACPEKARILPPPLQEQMDQKLGVLKDVRGKNEMFL